MDCQPCSQAADAAAVQYTRDPKGIGMALAKLGGLTGKLKSPHAEEASHMMFADAVAGSPFPGPAQPGTPPPGTHGRECAAQTRRS